MIPIASSLLINGPSAKVDPKGHAAELGVQVNWQIKQISGRVSAAAISLICSPLRRIGSPLGRIGVFIEIFIGILLYRFLGDFYPKWSGKAPNDVIMSGNYS